MGENQPHIVLFFTWDVSLAIWQEKGLLQREVRLYQALADKEVKVTFLSWGGEEDDAIAKSLAPQIETISLYKLIPRPHNKALRALCSLLAPFEIRKNLEHADILKTNQIWGGWVAALSKFISRKPLIARCGFELYDFTIKQGHSKLRQKLIWLISKITYASADHICVATQEDKNFVRKNFRQPGNKITLHPNWIDTDFFAPMQLQEKANTLLFVGRLSEQKNLKTLIDALGGTGFKLDIVGDGELRQALEQQAEQSKAQVRFLGTKPNDELPALYNSYPVFVLPSHFEGNPKTLLEAMACGRAVIGTDVYGIASVIEHEKSGLLCKPEADKIRDTIGRLMEDSELRQRLGKEARNQIIENQTLDRLVEKELACYRNLMREYR